MTSPSTPTPRDAFHVVRFQLNGTEYYVKSEIDAYKTRVRGLLRRIRTEAVAEDGGRRILSAETIAAIDAELEKG